MVVVALVWVVVVQVLTNRGQCSLLVRESFLVQKFIFQLLTAGKALRVNPLRAEVLRFGRRQSAYGKGADLGQERCIVRLGWV